MDVTTIQSSAGAQNVNQSDGSLSELSSDDFFKLLITQLTNQDPLEPTSNQDLLNQISSIRDIELSTSLTDSLGQLTGQQDFSSASSLIGKFVTVGGEFDQESQSGVVVGVRFAEGNQVIVQLASGEEVPIDHVQTIQSAQQAAQALIGKIVVGVARDGADSLEAQEGLVTGVRNDSGSVLLELDTGEVMRFEDIIGVRSAAA